MHLSNSHLSSLYRLSLRREGTRASAWLEMLGTCKSHLGRLHNVLVFCVSYLEFSWCFFQELS